MRGIIAAGLALLVAAGCQSRAPVQEQGVRATRPMSAIAPTREQTFVWPELRSGDCVMRPGATLVLRPDGTSRWSGTVWSTDDNDSWQMRFQAFASNDWTLFALPPASGDEKAHLTKAIPEARTDYRWDADPGTFDPSKFQHIDVVRLFYAC